MHGEVASIILKMPVQIWQEVSVMLFKHKRILCSLLVLIMFLSGMCSENVSADSLFECISENQTVSTIDSLNNDIKIAESCTIEMLGIRNISYVRSTAKRSMNRADLKTSLVCLNTDDFLHLLSDFHITAYAIQLPELRSEAVVLNYIHKKDGKK